MTRETQMEDKGNYKMSWVICFYKDFRGSRELFFKNTDAPQSYKSAVTGTNIKKCSQQRQTRENEEKLK